MTASLIVVTIKRPAARALVLALLMQGAGAAGAAGSEQDLTTLPLEQLLSMEVYSASKFVQKASEAPALVTVISAADIRYHGWRTLADVARSVRGQYVSYDRNYSYLGERGFLRPGDYNTRFLLQVDGNRLNDPVYDQAPLGAEFPLELDLIERIEFVPGPGSSIYGANAFFGVINVITKKTAEMPTVRTSAALGTAGQREASASTSWRLASGAEFLLAASGYRSAGKDLYFAEFDTPEQNHGIAVGLDHERGERVLARAGVGPTTLTLMHARRVKGVPTASFAQNFNDRRAQTTDRQSYLNLQHESAAGAVEQFKARLFWGAYDSFGDYIYDDPALVNHDGSSGRWWGAELSVLSNRFEHHTLLAGLDYQRDVRLDQYSFAVQPFESYLDQRGSGRRFGLYLQDDMRLATDQRLNLGLRYDRNTGAGGVWSPRIALIQTLGPATILKAIYGSAFRAPNSYERFYAVSGPGGQLPNPELGTEKITSAELALVHQFSPNRRLSVTVYRTSVAGLITLVQYLERPETQFENARRLGARGAEIEYEQRWSTGAALRTSYSHTQTGADNQEQQLNAPAHLAKLNLSMPVAGSLWWVGLETQYVGARRAINGKADSFWLVNLNLVRANLWRNTELSLNLTNLFDRSYADPGSTEHAQRTITQDGRQMRVRLSYAF